MKENQKKITKKNIPKKASLAVSDYKSQNQDMAKRYSNFRVDEEDQCQTCKGSSEELLKRKIEDAASIKKTRDAKNRGS